MKKKGGGVLGVDKARKRWPLMFERLVGTVPVSKKKGQGQGGDDGDDDDEEEEEDEDDDDSEDERAWGQTRGVLGGQAHHGRFGDLLRGFEDERIGERVRAVKREEMRKERESREEFEEESSDEEEEEEKERDKRDEDAGLMGGSLEERIAMFERAVREKWIAGLEEVRWSFSCSLSRLS